MKIEKHIVKVSSLNLKCFRCHLQDDIVDISSIIGETRTHNSEPRLVIGNPDFRILASKEEWKKLKELGDDILEDPIGSKELSKISNQSYNTLSRLAKDNLKRLDRDLQDIFGKSNSKKTRDKISKYRKSLEHFYK